MKLAFAIDEGPRTRLGLIVLQVDETVETEFRALLRDEDVDLYCTRVPSGKEVTVATLAAMAEHIPAAARLFPPAARLDAIGYACTSGATIIGSGRVADLVRGAAPSLSRAPVTDPLRATIEACRAVGARRLGFVSPYVPDVSAAMRRALEAGGIGINGFGSFEQAEERLVARIAPASVLDAILSVGASPDVEAVFVSCTNLRTLPVIADAERRLAKPVLSSNLALCWHMLRLAGVETAAAHPFALFRS